MSAKLHVVNLLSSLLPQTRVFGLRRGLYRVTGVHVGPNTRINGGVNIQHTNVRIGADTWIGRRSEIVSTIDASVTIGDRCDVSQDVLFITGSHEIGDPLRRAGTGTSLPISVGDGTWIGARVTLLGGAVLGSGVVVAAGSLVRDVFPDDVLVAGTPARIVRQLG
ncbi:acyltransferase [Cryobacterium sp. M25]|uniref:acyltransferase n=1 Tax=Cryobacterium sp. M25 TaxID=2048293 RepID=UPI000CE4CF01